MPVWAQEVVLYAGQALAAFGVLAVFFTVLAVFFPSNAAQPLVRRDMPTDLCFCFFVSPVYRPIRTFLSAGVFAGAFSWLLRPDGTSSLAEMPFWLQIVVMLVATDFLQYWTHRLSHTKPVWKFHAIHHSSPQVDWLSASRWHPLNFLFHDTLTVALVWSLGFSSETFPYIIAFYAVNGPLVHANVAWTYGPLKYVIASPVFHRWHHTAPEEGGEKNFAPYFSFFDVIFGTFYMPQGTPGNFGAPYDDVPPHFLGQLLYPFRRGKGRSP